MVGINPMSAVNREGEGAFSSHWKYVPEESERRNRRKKRKKTLKQEEACFRESSYFSAQGKLFGCTKIMYQPKRYRKPA